ncbi:MAG: group 1 truncated hemoglobin [Myxococcota bacterium]|nr:group 1 truncated hemoglobin [Myxococcota bacterium]
MEALEGVGGMAGLRELLTEFYRRVFRDPMIGYLFHGQDQSRLVEREVEWSARLLGAPVHYQGRSMAEVHRQHPIRRGHFHRRNQILRVLLEERELPVELRERWLAHNEKLAAAILGPAHGDLRCERRSDEGQLK